MTNQDLPTLISRAEKAYRSGDFAQSANCYRLGQQLSAAAGDTRKAAELANNASVALLQAGDARAALEAAQGTDEVFAQAGDFRAQAMALGNQAAALDALNRLDEALARYRLCSDLLKQAGDEENRAYVLKNISSLQIRTGHQLEALASMDAALQNTKKLSLKEKILKKLLRVPFQMLRRGG
jgi:tetratricopeptide (TPR) repeat protein